MTAEAIVDLLDQYVEHKVRNMINENPNINERRKLDDLKQQLAAALEKALAAKQ